MVVGFRKSKTPGQRPREAPEGVRRWLTRTANQWDKRPPDPIRDGRPPAEPSASRARSFVAKNLVIVESPAKAKTIEKYMGKDYKVLASMGHVRDLPKSDFGIEVNGGVKIAYEAINRASAKKAMTAIRKAAKGAETAGPAPDPGREGEAIAWHVAELAKLKPETTRRVTFNEITKKAVTEAFENPRSIDMALVDAQQARRAVDRIVGYKLSPLLWRNVGPNLSAGRVQSAALFLVVEREREIRAFNPVEYRDLTAKLATQAGAELTPLSAVGA